MAEVQEVKPMTLDEAGQKISVLEGVVGELLDRVESLVKEVASVKKTATTAATAAPVKKGLFGGHRQQTPMKDLLTGIVYISKAAVGKAFAAEIGEDPANTFVWYKVFTKLRMPKDNKAGLAEGSERFVAATEDEATKVRADVAAQAEKERAEAQALLDAEEAKKAAAAPAGTTGNTAPAAQKPAGAAPAGQKPGAKPAQKPAGTAPAAQK